MARQGQSANKRSVRLVLTGGMGLLVALTTTYAGATETAAAGEQYLDDCEAAGVPRPPVWNYEDAFHGVNGTEWQYHGVVDIETFISPNQTTEVFYYESTSPAGVCIALPRSDFPAGQTPDEGPPDVISLLGVICQGISGNACFHDQGEQWNGVGVDPFDTYQFGDGPVTSHFVSGAALDGPSGSLGGVCTDCHRGENVFIIHPRTLDDAREEIIDSALGFGIPNLIPNSWVNPITPVGWPQNEGPTDLFGPSDTDTCLKCHNEGARGEETFGGRFPTVSNLTASYCGFISESLMKTMPLIIEEGEIINMASYSTLLEACAAPPPDDVNPADKMMSMDGPAENYWSATPGGLSDNTSNFTEGTGSMSVNASGYVSVAGLPFDTFALQEIGNKVALDVFVPLTGQPNPYWLGAVQLLVTIPSASITNYFVGHVELTPPGKGWRKVSFTLPPVIVGKLREPQVGARFTITANTPQGAPPLLLDNMHFEGTMYAPPASPNQSIQYNFERTSTWDQYEGAVVGTSHNGPNAYSGFNSLVVAVDGGTEGRVWTETVSDLAPGTTVTYRVFIPSGAPVSAVQPYVADNNWNWSQSFNTNLPRNGWATVTAVVPSSAAAPVREVGIKFYLSAPYEGDIYVDAISW